MTPTLVEEFLRSLGRSVEKIFSQSHEGLDLFTKQFLIPEPKSTVSLKYVALSEK